MTVTDEDLIRRVAEGDQDAFLMLYDRFAPRVYGLIIKVLGAGGPARGSRGSGSEADDVLQEVMWEAWSRASRYDPSLGSVANWLLLMARSRTIDAIRKRRVQADAIDERARRQPTSATGDNPASDLVLNAAPRLQAALDELPPDQRTVITMAFLRGLTREEIAASLNIPVGTVKTRIRLGVKRLAELQPELGTAS